ncbi:hypothetical protein ACV229_05495 [Burkholderia sp. MR1-5-21]
MDKKKFARQRERQISRQFDREWVICRISDISMQQTASIIGLVIDKLK